MVADTPETAPIGNDGRNIASQPVRRFGPKHPKQCQHDVGGIRGSHMDTGSGKRLRQLSDIQQSARHGSGEFPRRSDGRVDPLWLVAHPKNGASAYMKANLGSTVW